MFAGRKLVIATMHQKEAVIAPPIENILGVDCFVAKNFNTDQFGTFSGEIERKMSPLDTARLKCYAAMKANACDLAIASEGSFGPHPSMFFVPADDELLVLIDKKNELEIVVREISTNTNFSSKEVSSKGELIEFAEQAKFPSHGLIMKSGGLSNQQILKGIQDWDLLLNTFDQQIQLYDSITIETDMRAHYNPTRMEVIQKAVAKLIEKINIVCPICGTPGFGISDRREGLPCSSCGFPTRSTLAHISTCQKCGHTREEVYPHGKTNEDPMYCDNCNP
jgi:ribosomal protein L37E